MSKQNHKCNRQPCLRHCFSCFAPLSLYPVELFKYFSERKKIIDLLEEQRHSENERIETERNLWMCRNQQPTFDNNTTLNRMVSLLTFFYDLFVSSVQKKNITVIGEQHLLLQSSWTFYDLNFR